MRFRCSSWCSLLQGGGRVQHIIHCRSHGDGFYSYRTWIQHSNSLKFKAFGCYAVGKGRGFSTLQHCRRRQLMTGSFTNFRSRCMFRQGIGLFGPPQCHKSPHGQAGEWLEMAVEFIMPGVLSIVANKVYQEAARHQHWKRHGVSISVRLRPVFEGGRVGETTLWIQDKVSLFRRDDATHPKCSWKVSAMFKMEYCQLSALLQGQVPPDMLGRNARVDTVTRVTTLVN